MTKDAVLGEHNKRQKTDMRMPYPLAKRVEELAELVGVPRNAIYAMGAAHLCALLSSLVHPGKKRAQLLQELEDLFQKVISAARKVA
jgi:hypothetical protein